MNLRYGKDLKGKLLKDLKDLKARVDNPLT